MRGFAEYVRDVLIVLVVLSLMAGFLTGWALVFAISYLIGAIYSVVYWKPNVELKVPRKR